MRGRGLMAGAVILSGAALLRGDDLPDVVHRGSLRVLVVPFSGDDEFFSLGSRPGFDHEMIDGFCQLERVKLEVVGVPSWDGLVPAPRADS